MMKVFALLMVVCNTYAMHFSNPPSPEYGNFTSINIIENNLRQDYGFFKCRTTAPCALVCRGAAIRNYYCDHVNGVCRCYAGIISTNGCELAPSGSKCYESYTDCLYPSVVTDVAMRYYCNTDLATKEAANSLLCVHVKVYPYYSCRDYDICKVLCGTKVAQCYFAKGICECPAELNNPSCKQQLSATTLCSEFGGRDSDKFICKYPTPTTDDPMQRKTYCVHNVKKPDTCRPLREVCTSMVDCCSNCCEKGTCIPSSMCPKTEYEALHADTA